MWGYGVLFIFVPKWCRQLGGTCDPIYPELVEGR